MEEIIRIIQASGLKTIQLRGGIGLLLIENVSDRFFKGHQITTVITANFDYNYEAGKFDIDPTKCEPDKYTLTRFVDYEVNQEWNGEPISIEHDIIEQYIVSHIEMCLDAIAC